MTCSKSTIFNNGFVGLSIQIILVLSLIANSILFKSLKSIKLNSKLDFFCLMSVNNL